MDFEGFFICTVGKKSNIVDLVKVKFGIYTSMSLYNGII